MIIFIFLTLCYPSSFPYEPHRITSILHLEKMKSLPLQQLYSLLHKKRCAIMGGPSILDVFWWIQPCVSILSYCMSVVDTAVSFLSGTV